MKRRLIVVGIITHKDAFLIMRKSDDFGVYAGTWGIPGGGVDEGEVIDEAFLREMKEETGLSFSSIKPLFFSDDTTVKMMRDGRKEEQYLVYLFYLAEAESDVVQLNDEHVEYVWVKMDEIERYTINEKTKETFERLQDYV